jgi:hypothetical protein
MRVGLAGLLVLLVAAPAAAQPANLERTKLVVRPAAPPVPALKYQLLPELRDTKPGNAVLLYYRAFSPEWSLHRNPDVYKALDQWYADTTKNPPDELRWVLRYAALTEIDLGARRQYADWELTERVRRDGITLLLPDIQSFRSYANLLRLRARFQVIDGEYDKALYTLQTGMALGRHLGESPTLIQALVGMAVSSVMLAEAEHLIQQPGAPNLYWALTTLPQPYIGLQKPMQGERIMIDALFPGLRELAKDLKAGPVSPQQTQELVSQASQIFRLGGVMHGPAAPDWEARLMLTAWATKVYPEAKQALIDLGHDPKQVEALPVVQVALLHAVLEYDRWFDEMLKWQALPYWQAHAGLRQMEEQFVKLRHNPAGEGWGTVLAHLLLPAVQRVHLASARLDRKIAALRCVEALRLYAAAHDGQLPAGWGDITEVPIPIDPVTGRPFEYKVSGNTATIYGPPPAGEKPDRANTLLYEVTVQR